MGSDDGGGGVGGPQGWWGLAQAHAESGRFSSRSARIERGHAQNRSGRTFEKRGERARLERLEVTFCSRGGEVGECVWSCWSNCVCFFSSRPSQPLYHLHHHHHQQLSHAATPPFALLAAEQKLPGASGSYSPQERAGWTVCAGVGSGEATKGPSPA